MKRIVNALDTYLFAVDHEAGEFVPTYIQVMYYGGLTASLVIGVGLLLISMT